MAIDKEQEETQQIPPKGFNVSHCQHTDAYSLGLSIEDSHVAISTAHYPATPGNYCNIDIYGCQPGDIKAIGEAILKEALKIEMEQEAETPEK